MDLTPFVDSLRRDLAAAGEAGGDTVRQAAERLSYALDPSIRLALMEALSEAAAEITADLASGSVEVRLDGRDVAFVVETTVESPDDGAAPRPTAPPPAAGSPDVEDGGTARVSLRLPDALKSLAEEQAANAGQSLNTWLVGAIRTAAEAGAPRVDLDLTSIPAGGRDPFGTRRHSSRRMTGWL